MRKIIKYVGAYGICWLLVINCGQTQTGSGGYKSTISSGGHRYVKIDTIEGDTVNTPVVLPQVTGSGSDGNSIESGCLIEPPAGDD